MSVMKTMVALAEGGHLANPHARLALNSCRDHWVTMSTLKSGCWHFLAAASHWGYWHAAQNDPMGSLPEDILWEIRWLSNTVCSGIWITLGMVPPFSHLLPQVLIGQNILKLVLATLGLISQTSGWEALHRALKKAAPSIDTSGDVFL